MKINNTRQKNMQNIVHETEDGCKEIDKASRVIQVSALITEEIHFDNVKFAVVEFDVLVNSTG